MANLLLFNTETRKKEPVPSERGCVRMYTCGPTVYHFAHIGNYRTYVFEDLLRRTLRFFGFAVQQVMNLTDVDDKTIKGAIAEGVDLTTFTRKYKDAFFVDLQELGIEPAEHYPAATDYFPQMIKMIKTLLDKEIAYKGEGGSIYYAISKFPRYGCLSHLKLDELKSGASKRVISDEYEKEQAADFVLWKAYDKERDGNIFWESPFGKGRPGWHLECSAMAMDILGKTIDIHVGGVDNIFPHHENEIAQSEACSGARFVKLWMHSEHLIVEGKKMSKSLGNFYTLRDLIAQGFSGRQVRYMLLQTHYKTQLNFTFEGLKGAAHTLQRLDDFLLRLNEITEEKKTSMQGKLNEKETAFRNALADDLNISQALAVLFDLIRHVNSAIDKNELGKEDVGAIKDLLVRFNDVLNIIDFHPEEMAPEELQEALDKRIAARKEKNWELADSLRDYIESCGYFIEDTPKGARLKKAETK